jgi:hypothetical protein
MQVCVGCTTTYSAGAPYCPHCGGKEFRLSSAPEGQVFVYGEDGGWLTVGPKSKKSEASDG